LEGQNSQRNAKKHAPRKALPKKGERFDRPRQSSFCRQWPSRPSVQRRGDGRSESSEKVANGEGRDILTSDGGDGPLHRERFRERKRAGDAQGRRGGKKTMLEGMKTMAVRGRSRAREGSIHREQKNQTGSNPERRGRRTKKAEEKKVKKGQYLIVRQRSLCKRRLGK